MKNKNFLKTIKIAYTRCEQPRIMTDYGELSLVLGSVNGFPVEHVMAGKAYFGSLGDDGRGVTLFNLDGKYISLDDEEHMKPLFTEEDYLRMYPTEIARREQRLQYAGQISKSQAIALLKDSPFMSLLGDFQVGSDWPEPPVRIMNKLAIRVSPLDAHEMMITWVYNHDGRHYILTSLK